MDASGNGENGPEKVGGFFAIPPLLAHSFEELDRAYHMGPAHPGVSTGLRALDAATSGLQNGDLILVAGQASAGKSALCQQIATSAALGARTVAYFSPTLAVHRWMEAVLMQTARVDAYRGRTGALSEHDWTSLADAFQRLWTAPLYVQDQCPVTTSEIEDACTALRQETERLDLVVVDNLLYVDVPNVVSQHAAQNHHFVARSLKVVARHLDVPLIVACPLFPSESRRDYAEHLRLSDLAGLEDYADVIFLLDGPQKEAHGNRIHVAKRRGGPASVVEVGFAPELNLFADSNKPVGKTPDSPERPDHL